MIIDQREPSQIKNHDWGFPTRLETLESADFIIDDGNIGIERKDISTGDLVNSIQGEGRLWDQLRNMEENFDQSILFIVGTIGDLPTRQMEPRNIEGIYGAVARIIVSYNVSVIWVRESSQMFKLIKKIQAKAGTEPSHKPSLSKRNFRDDRVNVLYGIYGIGNDTAKSLLEEFGSIRGVCNASKKELQRADGVGAKTAKKIYDIVRDGGDSEGALLP